MEYNTSKNYLVLPEYGRNVQMMAEHILTIEDRDLRTKAAHEIVNIMSNMFPQVKETKDYKIKLWDHLAYMTSYHLDVDFPFEITVTTEMAKGDRIAYNMNNIKFRHYGKVIQNLVEKALTFEEGPEKDALIVVIANHMKKQYLTWNKNSVTDEIIFEDLYNLSDGRLNIPDGTRLMQVSNQNNNTNNRNNPKNKKNNNNNKNQRRR